MFSIARASKTNYITLRAQCSDTCSDALVHALDVVTYHQDSHMIQCIDQQEHGVLPHCSPSVHPPCPPLVTPTYICGYFLPQCKRNRQNSQWQNLCHSCPCTYTLLAQATLNRTMLLQEPAYIALKGCNVTTLQTPVGQCTRSHDYPDSTSLHPVHALSMGSLFSSCSP